MGGLYIGGENEYEAWDDLLFGRGWDEDDGGHYADTLSYRSGRRKAQSREDYFAEEEKQPQFQQLIVTQLHAQTQKAYCVSGTVYFDTPYRGMRQFDFRADWIPKSQCVLTGKMARIPQWMIRSRWQQRRNNERTVDIKIPF